MIFHMTSLTQRKREEETYVASITTPTPVGFIASVIATAICFVSRS